MNPYFKIALMFFPTIILLVVILAAPTIGLGTNEQFVFYRWFSTSRSDSLIYVLVATVIALLYPTAVVIASSFSAKPLSKRENKIIGIGHGNYRPDIDGLRAVAVIAVIVNHFSEHLLPSGFLGVDIFFVISGFVILSSMIADRRNSVIEFLLNFYARRVMRIVPALVLFVLISGLAICLVSPNPKLSLNTAIVSLFGLSNIYLLSQSTDYFAPSTQYNTFTHTWSLGVEEQFYLMIPLLVYICVFHRKRINGRRTLLAILVTLTSASAIYYIKLFPTNPSAAFFLMPARFWELGLGCITYLLLSMGRTSNVFLRRQSGFLIILLFGALFAPAYLSHPATILIVSITAILIAVLTPESLAYKALTFRPVLFIGKISYSLYLWHWGILSVSRWFIGDSPWSTPFLLCCIFSMSALSYFYVESPLRKKVWTAHTWKTIIFGAYACIFSALLLEAFVLPLKYKFENIANKINPLKFQPEPISLINMSCHLPKASDPIGQCLRPVEPNKRIIYIIGDSHASNHVASIMLAAKHFDNLEVRYLVEWGFVSTLAGATKCKDHSSRPCMDDSFDKHMEFFTENLKPGDIVIFSWARDRVVYEGRLPRKPNYPAINILKDKLIEIRSVVTFKGAHLVFVDDIPKPCNNEVNWQIIYATGRYKLCSTTVDISKEDRRPLTELYKSLLTDKVNYFDPHDSLCIRGECGIYDPDSKMLIYAENSPHFPTSRASPLVDEWVYFFSHLLPNLPTSITQ